MTCVETNLTMSKPVGKKRKSFWISWVCLVILSLCIHCAKIILSKPHSQVLPSFHHLQYGKFAHRESLGTRLILSLMGTINYAGIILVHVCISTYARVSRVSGENSTKMTFPTWQTNLVLSAIFCHPLLQQRDYFSFLLCVVILQVNKIPPKLQRNVFIGCVHSPTWSGGSHHSLHHN